MSMTPRVRATTNTCYGNANSPVIRRNLSDYAGIPPIGPLGPLLAWIAARPGRAFAGFLALHAAVWTALPTLLYPNLPLDLIEALIYGREWQLGYDKLPPLPWWLVEIAYRLAGHDFAYYLLAQLAVVSAFAIIWAAARPLVGPLGALIAVLIVDGLHYLNYTSAKFNHDVIQLPFWALAGFAFHRALRGRQMTDWLLLGFAVGLSLWAKYFVAVLAIPLALFVLFDRDARQTLKTPGPYIAIAVALVTMAPHLVWLVQNDFLPFAYAEHRALPSRGLIDHVWHPLQFADQPVVLLASLAADRGAAVLSAPRAKRAAGRAAMPTPSTAASSRCSRSGRWRRCWRCPPSPAAAPWRCGAIRSGCSSACGSCSAPAALWRGSR